MFTGPQGAGALPTGGQQGRQQRARYVQDVGIHPQHMVLLAQGVGQQQVPQPGQEASPAALHAPAALRQDWALRWTCMQQQAACGVCAWSVAAVPMPELLALTDDEEARLLRWRSSDPCLGAGLGLQLARA